METTMGGSSRDGHIQVSSPEMHLQQKSGRGQECAFAYH